MNTARNKILPDFFHGLAVPIDGYQVVELMISEKYAIMGYMFVNSRYAFTKEYFSMYFLRRCNTFMGKCFI